MREKTIHRTVRLPEKDDARLLKLCDLSGLSISEQLRDLVRGAQVVAVIKVEQSIPDPMVQDSQNR